MLRFLLSVLLLLLVANTAAARTGRPEIVVIVDDDVTALSMGAYGEIGAAQTPNFDSLASAGQLYLNVTSSSLCTPTRRSIFYGESELQHGVGLVGQLGVGATLPDPARPNLILGLQSLGYRVVLVGKFHAKEVFAHVADPVADLGNVRAMGWDEMRALMIRVPNTEKPATPGSPHPSGNGHFHWIETDWQTGTGTIRTDYTTDLVTAETISLLQDDDPRPLALFVMYPAPHAPLNPPPGSTGGCAPDSHATDPSCYEPAIEYIDSKLPEIVAELDWDEDLLIKTADNGRPFETTQAGFCGPLNSKNYATPCGTRVPMLVRGQGVTSGTVSAVINLTDIHDTLLEFVGAPETGLDSISFIDCFSNPASCAPRDVGTSIRFFPNGFPLAMYNGAGYVGYKIWLNTIVNGHLYGMLRDWQREPTPTDPGPFTEVLYDLGPAAAIDQTRRYGQLVVAPVGDAGIAHQKMEDEADRLEASRGRLFAVPALSPIIRLWLAAGLVALAIVTRNKFGKPGPRSLEAGAG